MKENLVIPFKARLNAKTGFSSDSVANQLRQVIDQHTADGWAYVGVESVTTTVQGSSGCFGFGSTPSYNQVVQVIVFQR